MVCLREWPLRSRRTDVWYAAILPTRKIFCLLAFFHMAKQSRFPGENAFARVEQTSCQPGRQNRASPPKGVSRDFQVARRITGRTANQDRHLVFPFQTRDFAKPAPGETSQSKKPRFPIVFGLTQSPSILWLFQRVSVGASRPMSDAVSNPFVRGDWRRKQKCFASLPGVARLDRHSCTHTPLLPNTKQQQWPALPPPSPARSPPSRRPRSRYVARRARARVRAKFGATTRTFFREAIENASDANARARVERDAALSMTRRHPARRAACARSRPSRAFLFPMASRCARTPAPVGYGIPARPRWHAKSRLRDATSGD